MTANSPAATSTDREIDIGRMFDAPRWLVFQTWTDPKHVAQWRGPHGFTNPVCELDVRAGGIIPIDNRQSPTPSHRRRHAKNRITILL